MDQKGKTIDATSISLQKSPDALKTQDCRVLKTDDNNLTLTFNGGRLPSIDYNFDRKKLKQHVKLHALSKKIEKKKEAERAKAAERSNAQDDVKKQYQSLSHQRRIDVIHLRNVHKISLRKIAKMINSKPTAVRDTIIAYD